ncbi:MAG: hypothetical protein GX752_03915 [Clostridium sp.]|nr:hypothetical protein [Clostridium sp.]
MNKKLLIYQILVILIFILISIDFLRQGKVISLIVFVSVTVIFSLYTVLNFKNEKEKKKINNN